jgi:hypothetical protein
MNEPLPVSGEIPGGQPVGGISPETLSELQQTLPVLAPEEEASVRQLPDQTAQVADLLALLEDVRLALLVGTASPESAQPAPLQEDLLSGLSAWLAAWWQTLPDTVQEQASAPPPPQQLPLPEAQTPPESLSPPEPDEGPSERPEASGTAQEPVDWQESRSLLGELWEGISDAVQIVPNWLDEVLPDLTGPWIDELLSGLGGWVGSFFGSGESPLSPEPEATEPPAEAREASWWQEIPEVQREPVPLPEPEIAPEEPGLPPAPLPETAQEEGPAPLPAPEEPDIEWLTPEEELAQLEQVARATAERSRRDKEEILANAVLVAEQGPAALLATFPEPEPWDDEEAVAEPQDEEDQLRDQHARLVAANRVKDQQEILANLARLAPAASEEAALPEAEGVAPLAEIPEPLVEELETAAETEREDTPVDAGQAEPAAEVLGEIREGIGTLVDLMREFVQQRGETAPGDVSGPDRAPGHRSYAPPDVPSGASPSIHWRSTWGRRPAESEEEGGE